MTSGELNLSSCTGTGVQHPVGGKFYFSQCAPEAPNGSKIYTLRNEALKLLEENMHNSFLTLKWGRPFFQTITGQPEVNNKQVNLTTFKSTYNSNKTSVQQITTKRNRHTP